MRENVRITTESRKFRNGLSQKRMGEGNSGENLYRDSEIEIKKQLYRSTANFCQ